MREPKESSAERLSGEIGALLARLVSRDRGRELRLWDDLGQRRRLRQPEEDEERALDECGGDDLRERQRTEREHERDAAERESTARVGDEHGSLPVPAIDERSRRQVEEDVGKGLREADDSRSRRRVCQRQYEQRVSDATDACAERRDDLPRPQQVEVAVATERLELLLGRAQRRRRPLRARSIWRRICRFISAGTSVCSAAASRYASRSP